MRMQRRVQRRMTKVRRPVPEEGSVLDAGMADADTALEVEAAAVRLLAQREHSRHELLVKLRRRLGPEDLLQQVLNDLEQRGLLSDARFAESYVAMRIRKGYGPLRIRAELGQRGLDEALIEVNLDLGPEQWRSRLAAVAVQRFGETVPTSRAEQARHARFLEYRGFPESLIRDHLWG